MISLYNQHSPHSAQSLTWFPVFRIVKQSGDFWIDRRDKFKRPLKFLVIGVLLHDGNDGSQMDQKFRYANLKAEPLIQLVAGTSLLVTPFLEAHKQPRSHAAINEIISQMSSASG